VPTDGRPFAGRADEVFLVAMREVIPSATAPVRVPEHPDRDVVLGTVLPLNWAAMVRRNGSIVIALQAAARSADVGRDLGQALAAALVAAPGTGVSGLPVPAPGPRLAELVAPEPVVPTVHPGFDWWLEGADASVEAVTEALERANAQVVPTEVVAGMASAYWCRIGDREHLRWVLPDDEAPLLDAFARLSVDGGLALLDGGRYVGAFRALGLLVPVWDLPPGTAAADLSEPVVVLRDRLDLALGEPRSLRPDERRARAGLVARQVFLR
jgi:hypothetical protein